MEVSNTSRNVAVWGLAEGLGARVAVDANAVNSLKTPL